MDNLEGNSFKKRELKDTTKPKIEKMVSGKVVKKSSLSKKIGNGFIEGDGKTTLNYLLWDVLIPSTKEMLYNMFMNAVSMTFFGDRRNPDITRNRGSSYRQDEKPYYNYRGSTSINDRNYQRRTQTVIDDIILYDKIEAENVLDRLLDIIDQYQVVRVADLYELVGMKTDHTYSQNYGWDNLSSASVERVREGYLLKLPNPIQIRG